METREILLKADKVSLVCDRLPDGDKPIAYLDIDDSGSSRPVTGRKRKRVTV
jgi:hypothetical protein